MVTVITETATTKLANGRASGDSLWLSPDDVVEATGWTLKPEGLCRGEVCVGLSNGPSASVVENGEVDIAAFWRVLERPVLHNNDRDVWMFGAGSGERSQALQSLQAPDFELPDLSGKLHRLSDYRGKRVFLTTWSSW